MGYLIPKFDSFVLICLMAYQLLMGYLMLRFDSFGLVILMTYQLLMGYLMPKILLIYKCLIVIIISSLMIHHFLIICLHVVVWFQVFLCNTNNYMISSNNFYLIIVICLHTVIQFGLVYLHDGISIPYGLFNVEIWFICKYFIVMITIFQCSILFCFLIALSSL